MHWKNKILKKLWSLKIMVKLPFNFRSVGFAGWCVGLKWSSFINLHQNHSQKKVVCDNDVTQVKDHGS